MVYLHLLTNTVHFIDVKKADSITLGKNQLSSLFKLAQAFPDQWIGWSTAENPIWEEFTSQAQNNYTMLSAGAAPAFICSVIDYIEDSPFINYSPNQWYPTWIMSADQGMTHASILNEIQALPSTQNFEYDINLLARVIQKQGVFCYAKLNKKDVIASTQLAYRFVAQTQKKRWVPFLFLCHVRYEKRFPLYAFAKALFKKQQDKKVDLLAIQQTEPSQKKEAINYDVVIPTMGRKQYLFDVLTDLSNQEIKPNQVIIVEQNADPESNSELDYIFDDWSFTINHLFTHQTGACNARNISLGKTTADWILLFDDDVRVPVDFMAQLQHTLISTKVKAITVACLQKGEKETQQTVKQWPYFGSGCSLVHREIVDRCKFDKALEHGYGEDVDFGMQIRRAGYDVIYAPQIQILHLKAPVGGFREKRIFPWSTDNIQPKPSPHIMYFRKKNYSENQLKGYKLVQWFKNYGKLGSFLPWGHNKLFNKAWESSKKYANSL